MPDSLVLPICVVVPVYNDEPFIAQCLGSVRDQTRPPAEIILVDNASTDGSVAAAEALALPNLRIIRNERNLGASAARKMAVSETAQPYSCFLDSDDFLSKDALQSAFPKVAGDRSTVCLFRLVRTSRDGTEFVAETKSPAGELTGTEALERTIPHWLVHSLGVYPRDLVHRCQAQLTLHGYSDDELLSRLCLSEAGKVTGCGGVYYYRANPKAYTFERVSGQIRTHIRTAALGRERLGASHPNVRAARNQISRNLAGLVARVVRGQGSARIVADLQRQASSLGIRRGPRDLPYFAMDAAVSAFAALPLKGRS
jgi:glycosyltransferase involved in cell wall biosynthesis